MATQAETVETAQNFFRYFQHEITGEHQPFAGSCTAADPHISSATADG